MKSSPRPKRRTKKAEDAAFDAEMAATVERGNRNSQPPTGKAKGGVIKKMAGGGMCRGMGAATKGGKYKG
jgi:hypothetical protein